MIPQGKDVSFNTINSYIKKNGYKKSFFSVKFKKYKHCIIEPNRNLDIEKKIFNFYSNNKINDITDIIKLNKDLNFSNMIINNQNLIDIFIKKKKFKNV